MMSSMVTAGEMIYILAWFVWPDIVFSAGIPAEDTVRWTRAHYRLPDDEFLIRETGRMYIVPKRFADKSSLLPEQLFVMQWMSL